MIPQPKPDPEHIANWFKMEQFSRMAAAAAAAAASSGRSSDARADGADEADDEAREDSVDVDHDEEIAEDGMHEFVNGFFSICRSILCEVDMNYQDHEKQYVVRHRLSVSGQEVSELAALQLKRLGKAPLY